MNEEKIKKGTPTICRICFDKFGCDPQKRPRMLTCGHSYCHTCLDRVMAEQETICPLCKQKMKYATVEEVPVNYELQDAAKLISILENSLSTSEINAFSALSTADVSENPSLGAIALQNKIKQMKENKLKYEGHCSEHYLPNHFKCWNCSIWICGTCYFYKHKTCVVNSYEDTFSSLKDDSNYSIDKLTGDYVSKVNVLKSEIEEKQKICEELTTELIITKSELQTRQREKTKNENIIKNIREHRENIMKSETITDYEKVNHSFEEFLKKSNITVEVTKEDIQRILAKDVKILNGRITVLDPSKFCIKNNVRLRQLFIEGGHVKYGRIEVGTDGRIRIHHFEKSTLSTDSTPIQFENLLSGLNVEQFLPLEAFFEVYRGKEFLGEIIIQVDSLRGRGLNFILAAAGILHQNYKLLRTIPGCTSKSLEFDNESSIFPALVEGIHDGTGETWKELRRGHVSGVTVEAKNVNYVSFFVIHKIDISCRNQIIFGRVTKGMEVVDKIRDFDLFKDCGLII